MIWVEILAGFVIWLSFWSLIPRDEWWFRGADFPRLQILALGIIAFLLMLFWQEPWDLTRQIIFIALIATLAYQLKMVSVHDKFHRTLILSGFCLLKIAKISLNSSFFPKPIKR